MRNKLLLSAFIGIVWMTMGVSCGGGGGSSSRGSSLINNDMSMLNVNRGASGALQLVATLTKDRPAEVVNCDFTLNYLGADGMMAMTPMAESATSAADQPVVLTFNLDNLVPALDLSQASTLTVTADCMRDGEGEGGGTETGIVSVKEIESGMFLNDPVKFVETLEFEDPPGTPVEDDLTVFELKNRRSLILGDQPFFMTETTALVANTPFNCFESSCTANIKGEPGNTVECRVAPDADMQGMEIPQLSRNRAEQAGMFGIFYEFNAERWTNDESDDFIRYPSDATIEVRVEQNCIMPGLTIQNVQGTAEIEVDSDLIDDAASQATIEEFRVIPLAPASGFNFTFVISSDYQTAPDGITCAIETIEFGPEENRETLSAPSIPVSGPFVPFLAGTEQTISYGDLFQSMVDEGGELTDDNSDVDQDIDITAECTVAFSEQRFGEDEIDYDVADRLTITHSYTAPN